MNKLSVLILSSLIALSGCASVAEMAGYDSATLNSASAKNYNKIQQQAQAKKVIDTTSSTAKRIQTVFKRMKPFANQANTTGVPFDWEMTVIREETLNAWAMPGGKMAFYTGMVEKLNLSDAEIAAVVGHEMTHALLEHGKKDAGQKVLTNVAMNIGALVLQSQGINTDAISIGSSLLSEFGIDKPYSRTQEYQADAGGLRLMAQAGYNPQAAISVWEKMNKVNDNNNALNAIISTHPNNNARIDAMKKLLPEVLPIYEAAIKP